MKSLGRIGIIGGSGWLGSAIAQSLVASGKVAPADLICSYRSAKPGAAPWRLTKDNAELAAFADVIILSVRPQDWAAVDIAVPDKLVVSVMAGSQPRKHRQAHAIETPRADAAQCGGRGRMLLHARLRRLAADRRRRDRAGNLRNLRRGRRRR